MTDERINRLMRRRAKLTNRRDEHINRPAIAEIDAQLATVAPGQRNDVDLALGRPCAQLPPRVDYGLADTYAAIVEVLEREEQYQRMSAGQPDGIVEHYDSSTEGHW